MSPRAFHQMRLRGPHPGCRFGCRSSSPGRSDCSSKRTWRRPRRSLKASGDVESDETTKRRQSVKKPSCISGAQAFAPTVAVLFGPRDVLRTNKDSGRPRIERRVPPLVAGPLVLHRSRHDAVLAKPRDLDACHTPTSRRAHRRRRFRSKTNLLKHRHFMP